MNPEDAGPKEVRPTPKLLDRLREAIRLRHYGRRTEEAYVGWVRRYILFHHKRHPAEMAEREVTAFLSHLAQERQVSASTQNQALCAVLFLYRYVLERPLGQFDGLVWAKRSLHVPSVLTREEVVAVLARLSDVPWLVVALLYGAGLRLGECLELRVKDLDIGGSQIVVLSGKGGKDRRAPRGTDQACDLPFIPPFICDSSCRRRLGHPNRTGTVGAQGCGHDDGVHACAESGTVGRSESGRPASAGVAKGIGEERG